MIDEVTTITYKQTNKYIYVMSRISNNIYPKHKQIKKIKKKNKK